MNGEVAVGRRGIKELFFAETTKILVFKIQDIGAYYVKQMGMIQYRGKNR